MFIQIGVIDAGNFKGAAEMDNLHHQVSANIERYLAYMRTYGFYAEGYFDVGTDVVEEAENLCKKVAEKFSKVQFFAGQLVFQNDIFLTRLLHNYVVFSLQRRLYRYGWPMMILPIRITS